jgi:hypothetical protein
MTGYKSAINGSWPGNMAFPAGGMASATILCISGFHLFSSCLTQIETGSHFKAVMVAFLGKMQTGPVCRRLFSVTGYAVHIGIFTGVCDQVYMGFGFVHGIGITLMAGNTPELTMGGAEEIFFY